MEHRLANLEGAILQISVNIAGINGKLEDMPTKDWVTTRLAVTLSGTVVAILAGVSIIVWIANMSGAHIPAP